MGKVEQTYAIWQGAIESHKKLVAAHSRYIGKGDAEISSQRAIDEAAQLIADAKADWDAACAEAKNN